MSTWSSYFFKGKAEADIIPKDITPVDVTAKFAIKPITSSPISGSSLSPTKTAAPGPFPKRVVAVQATSHLRTQSNATPANKVNSAILPTRSQSTTAKKSGLLGFRAAIEPIAEDEQVINEPKDAPRATIHSSPEVRPFSPVDKEQRPTRKNSNATKLAELFGKDSVSAPIPTPKLEITAPKMPKFERAAEIEKGISSEREVFKAPKHLPPPSPGLKRPLALRDAVNAVVSQPKILRVVDDAIVAEEERRMAEFERRHEQIREEKERLDLAREKMDFEEANMQAEVDKWAAEEAEMLEYMTAVGIKVSSVLPKALVVEVEDQRQRDLKEKLAKEKEREITEDNLRHQKQQQLIEEANQRKRNSEERLQKEKEVEMAEDNLRFLQKQQQVEDEDEKTRRRNARNAADEALRMEEEMFATEQARLDRLSSNPSNYESTRSSAVVDETPDLESDFSDYEDDVYDDILLGYESADTEKPRPAKDAYRISFDIGSYEDNEPVSVRAKADYDAEKLKKEQQEEDEKLRFQMEEANRKMEEANRMLEEAKEYDRHRREEKAKAEKARILQVEEQKRKEEKSAFDAAEQEKQERMRREEERRLMMEEEKREASRRREQRVQGEKIAEQRRRDEEARFTEQRQWDELRTAEEEQRRVDAQDRYEEEQRRASTQVRQFVADEDKLFAEDQRRLQEENLKKQALFWQQRKLEAEAAKQERDNTPNSRPPVANNAWMGQPENPRRDGPPGGSNNMMSAPQNNGMRMGPPVSNGPMSGNRAPMGNGPPMRPMNNGPPMRRPDNAMRNGPPMNNNPQMGNRPTMGPMNMGPPMNNNVQMGNRPPMANGYMMRPRLSSDETPRRPPPSGNNSMTPPPPPPPPSSYGMMRPPPMNNTPSMNTTPPIALVEPANDEAFDKEEEIRKAEEKIKQAFAAMAGNSAPPTNSTSPPAVPISQYNSGVSSQTIQPRPSIRSKSPFPPRAEMDRSSSSKGSLSRIEVRSPPPSEGEPTSPARSDFSARSDSSRPSIKGGLPMGQRGKVGAFPTMPRVARPAPPPKEGSSSMSQQQERPVPPPKEEEVVLRTEVKRINTGTGRMPPPRGGLPSGPRIGLPSGPKMRR